MPDRETELEIVRRAYAKRVMFAADVVDRRIEAAFAAISRERFLDRGPWRIVRWDGVRGGRGYATTPSRSPVYVYDDVVIAILPEKSLNNGQPSLHARLIAAAAPRTGEHVVHIGTGTGYYTAILAHLVGRRGRVTAIEYDASLAARTARNLAGQGTVTVVPGDGTQVDFALADVIYVNAGATRPPDAWLDRLKDGGRLILPLTAHEFPRADVRQGAVFRIERRGDEFLAARVSAVAIFPCAGGRDDAGEVTLATAFAKGGADRVTRLYRGGALPPAEQCWLRTEDWALAYG
jgi:protein-L-isoaspartate(D-aspartate) O-methyltransferase